MSHGLCFALMDYHSLTINTGVQFAAMRSFLFFIVPNTVSAWLVGLSFKVCH